MTVASSAHLQKARILACCSFFLFALADTISKYASVAYSVNQVVFVATAVTFVPVLIFMHLTGDKSYWPKTKQIICILRNAFVTISILLLVHSFTYQPIADSYAFSFTAPLIVAILSGLLLAEPVTKRQWLAIVVGFLGVLLILRPGFGGFNLGMPLAFASAVCFAFGIVLLRRIGTAETPGSILIMFLIVTLCITGVFLPFEWRMPQAWGDWILMGMIGLSAGLAHISMVLAFRHVPAAALAPFQYTQIVWGILLGILVFGDWPSLTVLAGVAIVMVAGMAVMLEPARSRTAQ
jgi:drug/metabolite transporter (DMT)-like permease